MTDTQGVDAGPGARPMTARRVLVADDSVDAAESVGMLLELRGHEVRLAHTGRQAIELAAHYRPDVILLDISLPDMSGYEVAQALQGAAGEARPVLIAVTGFGREEDRARTREAGIDLHLTKPVEPAKLLDLLATLGEPRSLSEPER